ncbi:hypothetical protein TNCV_3999991 [Trichonephila clavipes]|nr:hypothetical protein TNCV_1039791 [Trichonephila clavipes]GFX36837.1 hypothetical protein TNCV_3999991 [Trichonephila clavipes]
MGARPVVKSVSMSVWAPWVPTWVVSIKITKKHDLGTGVENSIKLRRVNMIPRRLVNARQREFVHDFLEHSSELAHHRRHLLHKYLGFRKRFATVFA